MQKITPFLWFDGTAEEAAKFYASIFKNSKVGEMMRYDKTTAEATDTPEGTVLTVEFELDGVPFIGLNGGPQFKFTEAVSFAIHCDSQDEVDYFWSKLAADGGEESMCGWLKDKFGLSWQVTPRALIRMMKEGEPEQVQRMMAAMMEMKKLDMAALERAYKGC